MSNLIAINTFAPLTRDMLYMQNNLQNFGKNAWALQIFIFFHKLYYKWKC